jgi:two-component system, OmpR family, alkaline phosphatase synthesis response regulator PhoP
MPTILVVDDEPRIVEIATDYLERAGFAVVTAADGVRALEVARAEAPALVVLDLKLPRLGGMDVAQALRRESSVPIIMLTARADEADRLRGLEIGADDYVTKPFSPRELVARVRAVLRRAPAADRSDVIRAADVVVDPARMSVTRGRITVDLTSTEVQLVAVRARQPGRVFTRSQLLDVIGGHEIESYERAIDTHVKNIRHKLEPDPRHPRYVLTVYGVGYRFADA